MKKIIITAGAALTAAAAAFLAPSFSTACPTEDHPTACHWDASAQGNGEGSNFLVTLTGHTVRLP